MGYTHYWRISRAISKANWANFCNNVRRVLDDPQIAPLVCMEDDQPDQPPQVDGTQVVFNGKGPEGHETFVLVPGPAEFTFCKTAQKPYDLAVCLVLLLAQYLPDIRISSDGRWDGEWKPAREAYRRIFGREAKCPWGEEEN